MIKKSQRVIAYFLLASQLLTGCGIAAVELGPDADVSASDVTQLPPSSTSSQVEVPNPKRKRVLEALRQNSRDFKYASEEFRTDRAFVLEAVKQNGWALQFASEDLRGDREIVLEAVKQTWNALVCAREELKKDKEIVLEAVKQNGWALWYASEELRGAKAFVLEAVKQNGNVFGCASVELRADQEFILEAVRHDGKVLRYASKELNGNQEFVIKAYQCTNSDSREGILNVIREINGAIIDCIQKTNLAVNKLPRAPVITISDLVMLEEEGKIGTVKIIVSNVKK